MENLQNRTQGNRNNADAETCAWLAALTEERMREAARLAAACIVRAIPISLIDAAIADAVNPAAQPTAAAPCIKNDTQ